MSRLYEYTTLLDNGSWGTLTKPILEEIPRVDPKAIDRYKRIILIERLTALKQERSLGREYNSGDSHDTFKISIATTSKDDLDKIITQLRDIHVDISTIYYSSIEIAGEIEYFPEIGRSGCSYLINAYFTGKQK